MKVVKEKIPNSSSPLFGTIESILAKIEKQSLSINANKLMKAYEFSKKAHEGQKRRSGEDYIIHPLHVAEILVDLGHGSRERHHRTLA